MQQSKERCDITSDTTAHWEKCFGSAVYYTISVINNLDFDSSHLCNYVSILNRTLVTAKCNQLNIQLCTACAATVDTIKANAWQCR